MSNDFLDELAELALGSRLKRLAERMSADAAEVYAHFEKPIQPKWFPLLALLAEKGPTGVVDASAQLGLSQPAISQFSRQLVAVGLVVSKADSEDSRKRVMALTQRGQAEVEAMQPMWQAVRKAAEDLCVALDNDFYPALQKLERALNERSLLQRTVEHYDENR